MSVRLALDRDASRVPVIERAAASLYAPYGLEAALLETVTPSRRIERAIRHGELLVATDAQDRAVGYALFSLDGLDAQLEELAVMPSHGRSGHGTRLVEAVRRLGRDAGATRLTLVTLDFVPFGASFYLARGFERLASDEIPSSLRAFLDPELADGRVALVARLTE